MALDYLLLWVRLSPWRETLTAVFTCCRLSRLGAPAWRPGWGSRPGVLDAGPLARGRMGTRPSKEKEMHSGKWELFGSISPAPLLLQEVHRYYEVVGREMRVWW